MSSVFAQLGINNISLDYAKYQAVKGSSGDYVDFLMHYDSAASEEGDDTWMTNLLGGDDILSSMSPEMLSTVSANGGLESMMSAYSSKKDSIGVFDMQVSALKLQLVEAFKKRYENEPNEELKNAKIAALYTQAASVSIPSRFLG